MDTFARGTAQYDEAHGLYLSRRDELVVVSPGEPVPKGRRWERVTSLAHPGIAREMAETPAGRAALLDSIEFRHYGLTGAGQGCDIAEFQTSTPSGFTFYLPRLLNENNREDVRWRQHKANIDSWGLPAGPYGIIRPGAVDPGTWANHFADLIGQTSWAFIPTIDVELGDPAANRAFVAGAIPVLKARGYRRIMGYFSTGSAFRQQTQDLFDEWWGACWGCGFPAGFAVHQWQGSPLDRDYCPDFARISMGASGPPTPEDPLGAFTGADLVGIFELAQMHLLQTNNDYVNTLLSIASHSPGYWNTPGYEDALDTVMWTVNQTPVSAQGGGMTIGEALSKLVGVPHAPLTLPPAKEAKQLVTASGIRDADARLHEGLARISARLAS